MKYKTAMKSKQERKTTQNVSKECRKMRGRVCIAPEIFQGIKKRKVYTDSPTVFEEELNDLDTYYFDR